MRYDANNQKAYAEMQARAAEGYSEFTSPTNSVEAMPVTASLVEQLGNLGGMAAEINSRLWVLRDRLLGPQPPTGSGSQGVDKVSRSPDCFADMAQSRLDVLNNTLNLMEIVSAELARRF